MELFDISRTLSTQLPPWPGDTPFEFALKWRMSEGAAVNVGAIETSVHNGTHADAPFHFDASGASVERLPLDAYLGSAVVVDLSDAFAAGVQREITIDDLSIAKAAIEQTSRVLLKTGVWRDPGKFPQWIPVLAPNVAHWLARKRVKLIGLDLPSVDPLDAKELANHHALAAAGICIVESLDLSGVTAGIYNFVALPLKIVGADGAPVRAVLWRDAA